MRGIERLFCLYMRMLWAAAVAEGRGVPADWQPKHPDTSGAACRCLMPARTMLPGW